MKVLYPGLLMGTGYPHMTEHAISEIQFGFSFDAVTGLPYYPGSSLKGTLRTPFDHALQQAKKEQDAEQVAAQAAEYQAYLVDLFHQAGATEMDTGKLAAFTSLTFAGQLPGETEACLPMAVRDVFYDTYPIGFSRDGAPAKIVDIDHITPHIDLKTHKQAPLQNPTPLTLLRVMPDTCFKFHMRLHDFVLEGKTYVTAAQKLEVFQQVLEDFGIGAKTHTGYGNLELVDEAQVSLQLHAAQQGA